MPNDAECYEKLKQMGFADEYINRGLKVYRRNYKTPYDLDVVTEIIYRLEKKDEQKALTAANSAINPLNNPKSKKSERSPSEGAEGNESSMPQSAASTKQNTLQPSKSAPTRDQSATSLAESSRKKALENREPSSDKNSMNQIIFRQTPSSPAPSTQKSVPKTSKIEPMQVDRRDEDKNTTTKITKNKNNSNNNFNNNSNGNININGNTINGDNGLNNRNRILGSDSDLTLKHMRSDDIHMRDITTDMPKVGDRVQYRRSGGGVVIAEVMQVASPTKCKISYPAEKNLAERDVAFTDLRQIQKTPENHPNFPTQRPSLEESIVKTSSSSSKKFSQQPPIPEYVPHMTIEEAEDLQIDDFIDHRDEVGRFLRATIVNKIDSRLQVHYVGWSRKWDCASDYRKELYRFAKSGSISKRPAYRFKHLKKGDFVDIKPMRHNKWVNGEIRRLDTDSGQVQVVYEADGKNFLWWAHLDDKDTIADFGSMPRARGEREIPMQDRRSANQEMSTLDEHNIQYYYDPQALARFRAQKFPIEKNEKLNNKFTIGDWLEVQDVRTGTWIPANVVDAENNWIVIHYDGFDSQHDQRVHVVNMKDRLRALGGGLQPDEIELKIKEEMENFMKELRKKNWELVAIQADGNCLYRSFAHEIYGDQNEHMRVRQECVEYMRSHQEFFKNFILDWDETLKQKSQQYEWGDHVDINAMSEIYNVRVRVFELDKDNNLRMSYEQGGAHESTKDLPVILLARHREKHYNLIKDPENRAKYPVPLGLPQERGDTVWIRDLREEEEKITPQNLEEKEVKADQEEKNIEQEGDAKETTLDPKFQTRKNFVTSTKTTIDNNTTSSPVKYLFQVKLEDNEFIKILVAHRLQDKQNLDSNEIKKILPNCIKEFIAKARRKYEKESIPISKEALDEFCCKKDSPEFVKKDITQFINYLKEKCDVLKRDMVLTLFNKIYADRFTKELNMLIESRTC